MAINTIKNNKEIHLYNDADLKKTESVKLNIIKNNRQKFIDEMLQMDLKKLNKNYALVVKQLQKAYQTNNTKAVEILFEMESQILEALVLKIDE